MASPSSAVIHQMETGGVVLGAEGDSNRLERVHEAPEDVAAKGIGSGTSGATVEVDNDSGLPIVHPPPLQPELTSSYAMRLAEYWYGGLGPYRHLYRMHARKAYRNSETQWSIKFQVEPNPGGIYFRRFHYQELDRGESERGYECVEWSEDPETPEEDDFDPTEYDEGDDLETLEEEEQMALDARESHEAEVNGLEADNELPLEELLAKYGMQSSTPLEDPLAGNCKREASEEDPGGISSGRTRRRKRRRVSAPPEQHPDTTPTASAHVGSGTVQHTVAVGETPPDPADTPKGTDSAATAPAAAIGLPDNGRTMAGERHFAAPAAVAVGATSASGPLATRTAAAVPLGRQASGDGANSHSNPHHYLEEDTPEKRDKRLRNYFDPSMYEEDTEIYTANADMKEIRIGEGFQASAEQIGNVGDVSCSDPAQHCTLMWSPPTELLPAVDAYLNRATLALDANGRSIETAHMHLQQCAHDVARAEKEVSAHVVAGTVPWSDAEVHQFEYGLYLHGKAFGALRPMLPNRTLREIIEHYYVWKRSERYDLFVAQYNGYHGVARHKDTVRPGLPVDAYAVPQRRWSRDRRESSASHDEIHSDTESMPGTEDSAAPAAGKSAVSDGENNATIA
eukprot:m.313726 g.313726  ORF g.313726 m.313726 type:complete len:625 (-) comp20258_c0_seq1:193-2067(-)